MYRTKRPFAADFVSRQDRKTYDRECFSRSSVMQAGTEYNGDFRLHVKLHATHESNDSDRFDGDIEQQQRSTFAFQRIGVDAG